MATKAKTLEKPKAIANNTRSVNKADKLGRRNTSMDIIRTVAVFFVVSIHFFLNNGYYSESHVGISMYIMCTMRTLFTACIPLFLILTGYLMSKKTLCKGYYLGLVRILLIYIMSSIACVLFKIKYVFLEIDFKTAVLELLSFKMAPYSWYIEMYIGLFLLIPFFNIMYNGLNTQKNKKALLVTFFIISILPTAFNIFSFTGEEVWYNPDTLASISKIFPDWWEMLYPFAFYFVGCYIREYGLKIKTPVAIILLLVSIAGFGAFNFFRSYHTVFEDSKYISWQGIEPFIMAVLIFTLLSRIKADKLPRWLRWILWKVSDSALGIYLLSYIFDTMAYPILLSRVPVMTDRLKYYFVIVPVVFIGSMVLSLLLNIILKLLGFVAQQFKDIFAVLKSDTPQENTENEN